MDSIHSSTNKEISYYSSPQHNTNNTRPQLADPSKIYEDISDINLDLENTSRKSNNYIENGIDQSNRIDKHVKYRENVHI